MLGRDVGPPPPFRGNEVMSPTLPLPPPRDLESLSLLLDWIASAPRKALGQVREEIRRLEGQQEVVVLLHRSLLDLPVADPSRHLLLLSVLGELRAQASLDVLEQFVWLADRDVYGETGDSSAPCDFSPAGALQARAAEMLVWVIGTDEDERVLRIIREHPSNSVRIAAIDAWLYQRDDSPDAAAVMNGLVRDGDEWAVGLPRWSADMDPQLFHRRVAELAERFGDEAELPNRTEGRPDVS